MPDAGQNLIDAFPRLDEELRTAIRTRSNEPTILQEKRQRLLRFMDALDMAVLTPQDLNSMRRRLAELQRRIDLAVHISNDIPDAPCPKVSYLRYTGKRGRPRKEINRDWLAWAKTQRKNPGIAPEVGTSVRTVRRRIVEYGLAPPGQPVSQRTTMADGTIRVTYNGRASDFALSDDELDALMARHLETFPNFGRRMLTGAFSLDGHRVPRDRLNASYSRVHGAPAGFGIRRIHRRKYRVAGPNSLWHHDGQHGLIRFKIVIHAFVDGFSRYVVGIKVNDNNRGKSVLGLFHRARSMHGTPSRVRGDHGVENILVAAWMEENRGQGRGSYLFGRSVHNTRIERLWYDVTHGFGSKWKDFFLDLEHNHGLNPVILTHIWLLHYLFLNAIDEDAQEWGNVWNAHKMQIRGERSRSPADMYGFGILHNGPRGINWRPHPPIPEERMNDTDLAQYGVDYAVHHNARIMRHLYANNADEQDVSAAFERPDHVNEVRCDPPNCPFTDHTLSMFHAELHRRAAHLMYSRVMSSRALLWDCAFALMAEFM